jgi:hypothetical protein
MAKITEKKTGMKIEVKEAKSSIIGRGIINLMITNKEGKRIVNLSVWEDGGTLMHDAKDVTVSQYDIAYHEILGSQYNIIFN